MGRILLLLKLALVAIPVLILGYLLRLAFSHMPGWLYYFLTIVPPVVLGIFLIRRQRAGYVSRDEVDYMPEWLSSNSVYVYLVLGTLLGSGLSASSNRTALYLDNGSDQALTVKIKHEGDFVVEPHQHVQASVALGENEIDFGKGPRKYVFPEDGKWVLNLNNANTYAETVVDYSNPDLLYKNGVRPDSTGNPEFKLIKEEFFKTKADFLFEAPERILVKKKSAGEDVKKTVLLRL